MLPTVKFCGYDVTRLTIGNNPFAGVTYIDDMVSSDDMMNYYTADKMEEALFEAESAGFNTYQALACPFVLRVLRQYRNNGGKMQIIFQTHRAIELKENLRMVLPFEPIAVYQQGGVTDALMECGDMETMKANLKIIRDTGVKVGISTHIPETIYRAEEQGWDLDFFMTCLHNARKPYRENETSYYNGDPKRIHFYPDDRALMFNAIRSTSKHCIAFKILAGGQIFYGKTPEQYPDAVEAAFRETYANIKPNDIATIGVFQKNKNQIRENAELLKKVLG